MLLVLLVIKGIRGLGMVKVGFRPGLCLESVSKPSSCKDDRTVSRTKMPMSLWILILNIRIGDMLITVKASRPSVQPEAVRRIYSGYTGDFSLRGHLLWLHYTPDAYRWALKCLKAVREPLEGVRRGLRRSLDCFKTQSSKCQRSTPSRVAYLEGCHWTLDLYI